MSNRVIAIENYWPKVVRDTVEFQQIATAENPEFNNIYSCLKRLLSDAFVQDSTEYGVSRWEKILELSPSPLATLEERKTAILTFLSINVPYTMRVLENMLIAAVGEGNFTMNLINDTQTLHIRLKVQPNWTLTLNEPTIFDLADDLIEVNITWNCTCDAAEYVVIVDGITEYEGRDASCWLVLPDGEHSYSVTATDAYGVSITVSSTFTYDVVMPMALSNEKHMIRSIEHPVLREVRYLMQRIIPQNLVLKLEVVYD